MWRFESVHERLQTRFLDEVIRWVERDEHLSGHARSLIEAAASQEPLIAQSLKTPQDIRYHAEGPVLFDHLQLMLAFLFAVVEEKIHLIDIEEFRRLKGYEGEIEELEELLKEQVSFFHVFILCHDAAKWPSVSFASRKGSKGEFLGFQTSRAHMYDQSVPERMKWLNEYLRLYQDFSVQQSTNSDREKQSSFYLTYGIDVHYPNHARKIHAPVFEALLNRFSQAHQLPSRDREMLGDLIAHHMEFGADFSQVRPSRIERYIHLSSRRGYDADDFIDLLQGCLFLDHVVGSKRLNPHGYWHDPSSLIFCLKSEHDWAPHRRAQKEVAREERERKERLQLFKEAGLDGVALMDLLEMDPGSEFGLVLRRIHAAILGQGDLPKFGEPIDQELENRIAVFYQKLFSQKV
ncbi:MAG: hypothetical protein UT30_C0016G0014 [Candidatus Uhrbacteria bacterium GW2011_GWF2_39_13]|uniref:Uncharacterized protein n=1 Tax=Candidatus Uhrbacteria bacterium GW2011_GWF2_39_13 TaxID=1618995 RepID=A0A0G0MLA9_9BACT|nr:MAG: hypothetical protein UT30_C0016G0014 [Candidatus Uhrbacteria bacterium GW2011_GWF2_39_13]HAU66478.1 hypothetical protein [Candidatus Uhrbacteria bacterium]